MSKCEGKEIFGPCTNFNLEKSEFLQVKTGFDVHWIVVFAKQRSLFHNVELNEMKCFGSFYLVIALSCTNFFSINPYGWMDGWLVFSQVHPISQFLISELVTALQTLGVNKHYSRVVIP